MQGPFLGRLASLRDPLFSSVRGQARMLLEASGRRGGESAASSPAAGGSSGLGDGGALAAVACRPDRRRRSGSGAGVKGIHSTCSNRGRRIRIQPDGHPRQAPPYGAARYTMSEETKRGSAPVALRSVCAAVAHPLRCSGDGHTARALPRPPTVVWGALARAVLATRERCDPGARFTQCAIHPVGD